MPANVDVQARQLSSVNPLYLLVIEEHSKIVQRQLHIKITKHYNLYTQKLVDCYNKDLKINGKKENTVVWNSKAGQILT